MHLIIAITLNFVKIIAITLKSIKNFNNTLIGATIRINDLKESLKTNQGTISNLYAEQEKLKNSLKHTTRMSYGDYMQLSRSERDKALETIYFDLWQDGIKAGYDSQVGLITKEESLWLIPGAGSSPAVADGERGYYAGILMACAEGYVTDECDFAEEYADTFGLMRVEISDE